MGYLRAAFTISALANLITSNAQVIDKDNCYSHVAVFSIDGLHSSDIEKYTSVRPNSTISALLETAYLYPNANTSAPSDSLPGTLAQYTGASPKTTGVWYDVIYDRGFYPAGSNCTGAPGTEVADDETIDYNSAQLFSGGIDPALLVEYIDASGACKPLYPHNRVRVNTVFEIVVSKGYQTAYADKHPAYDIVRGPSGTGLTVGYFPEIASIPGSNISAAIAYDQLHTQAFLDWLDGKTPANSEGKLTTIPTLFGGNFQSVNVAQKVVGYLNDTNHSLSPGLLSALDATDNALGQVVTKLKTKGIYDQTLIIVASKHGQSPINAQVKVDISPDLLTNLTGVPVTYLTNDDIGLFFLENTYDTQKAIDNLNANAVAGHVFQLYSEAPSGSLSLVKNGFGSPLSDPAVPDIIVAPIPGTIYTGNTKKFAEHGGITNDDRNVACFASSPRLKQKIFNQKVSTQQIGPSILKALNLDPTELEGAVVENIKVLPGF